MSCCGEKRAQARQATQTQPVAKVTGGPASQYRGEHNSPAYFQYIGKRGLAVVGPQTRKLYRFDGPGAVVAVDPKDKRALTAVSALKQVEK